MQWDTGGKQYDPPRSKAYDKLHRIQGIYSLIRGTYNGAFVIDVIVRSTLSMLMLGGSGGCPPGNLLKNRYSVIESEGILESKYQPK